MDIHAECLEGPFPAPEELSQEGPPVLVGDDDAPGLLLGLLRAIQIRNFFKLTLFARAYWDY